MFNIFRSLFKPKSPEIPVAWQIFALRNPELAKADTASVLTYDRGLLLTLAEVNRRVNSGIKPRNERGDTWSVWPEYGDCDDYVMTKRVELIKAGLPIGALRIAVCQTERGENHAVLVVVTSSEEYVLDNRRSDIRTRSACGYRWISMSSADPSKWIAL